MAARLLLRGESGRILLRFSLYQLTEPVVKQLRVVKVGSTLQTRWLRTTSYSLTDPSPVSTTVANIKPVEATPEEEDLYREHFIPITRRSIIRYLMDKDGFLTEEEKKVYEDFALALDSAIVNKYHGILQDLKTLFDPINPDKDTIQTRQWNSRERLDNEFWLLQRLEDLVEKASFHELPKSFVQKVLEEHEVREGVRVSIDPNKYAVLRFWALGREKPKIEVKWYEELLQKILRRPAMEKDGIEYYKRVVVAIRLKKDHKLLLKAFKEVPVSSLEMLLPDGKINMTKIDKGILTFSLGLAGAGIVAKIVTLMAKIHIDWMLLVTMVTGLIGVRGWTVYKNRRNSYMVDLSRMLYFKNIANNRGLLALLVDRAEDESFKEALLVYSFLLANRPPSALTKGSNQLLPVDLGGIPDVQLEKNIEEWILEKTNSSVDFDSSEAVKLLKNLGILSVVNDKLHVLNLQAAIRNLPQQPQSLIARAEESDIYEGYDRDEFLETEEEYRDEEKKSKRYGWF
ncbi:hypothetical protein ScPMuIL_002044 [Solemya velum]